MKNKFIFFTKLSKIEKRLLEIDKEKVTRSINLRENYGGTVDDFMETDDIEYLDTEKAQLLLKRQFILDRRENWSAKIIWNLVIPTIVALITAYITVKLVK